MGRETIRLVYTHIYCKQKLEYGDFKLTKPALYALNKQFIFQSLTVLFFSLAIVIRNNCLIQFTLYLCSIFTYNPLVRTQSITIVIYLRIYMNYQDYKLRYCLSYYFIIRLSELLKKKTNINSPSVSMFARYDTFF